MEQQPKQLQKKTLSLLSEKLHKLPMLPTIVSRMMTLNPSDDDFQEDVLDLLQEDPTFAARLIQLANSAYSHPTVPIVSLKDALVRMGSVNVFNLISSLSVIKVFMPSNQFQKDLWVHSIQVAVATRTISIASTDNVIRPDEAYLCGLMHDIGRFIMFSDSPEELGKVDERKYKNPKDLIKVEREICGFDHAEMGWHACLNWQLPELVTNVVKHHHHYKMANSNSPEIIVIGKIIRIVQMADYLSMAMMKIENFDLLSEAEIRGFINHRCLVSSWSELPVPVDTLAKLAKSIFFEAEKLVKNLGLR